MATEPMDPDAERMLAVRDGDGRAFRELFEKYSSRMVAYVDRFFHNRALSEEITQEIFVKVYRARKRYEVRAKFSTWLYTIASRTCLNELRRAQHRVVSGPLDENRSVPGRGPITAEAVVAGKEMQRAIEEVIAGLPENQRLALLLTRFGGHSYAEAAGMLSLSESAVKSAIFRAASAIRQMVEHRGGPEPTTKPDEKESA